MSLYTSIARPPSKRSTGVGQDFSFREPQEHRNFWCQASPKQQKWKKHPNHKLSVGPGFQRYAGKFLDCLYLQNENDEHRRFVWSCESFIFWDFQRSWPIFVVLKESPPAAFCCDGFCSSEVHWLEEELRQTRARHRNNRWRLGSDGVSTRGSAGVSWESQMPWNFMNGRIQIQTVIPKHFVFFQFSSSAYKKATKPFGILFLTVWKFFMGFADWVRSSGTHELSAMWIQSADDLAKWGNPGGGVIQEYLKTNAWTPKNSRSFFFSEKKQQLPNLHFFGFLG